MKTKKDKYKSKKKEILQNTYPQTHASHYQHSPLYLTHMQSLSKQLKEDELELIMK